MRGIHPSFVMPITPRQRRELRALGHHLNPIVAVGKEGVTEGVVSALDVALTTHELVKVRIGQNCELDKHEAAATLAEQTGSEIASVLGNTILLYRRHPEKPKLLVEP